MAKGEPDRGEILDTLEMVYAWHTMRFVEFFRRYADTGNSGNMWEAVRSALERAGSDIERKRKRVSKSWRLSR